MIVPQKRCWNLKIYFRTLFYLIFNWSDYPLISSTKSGPRPELELCNDQLPVEVKMKLVLEALELSTSEPLSVPDGQPYQTDFRTDFTTSKLRASKATAALGDLGPGCLLLLTHQQLQLGQAPLIQCSCTTDAVQLHCSSVRQAAWGLMVPPCQLLGRLACQA